MTFRALVLWLCLGSAAALAQTAIKNPAWNQLSQEEQEVLAPIEAEWESLAPQRKLKWILLAHRYTKLNPEQQARLQDQMRDWATLSADERRAARERYREIEKLPVAERQALREKWEQYQREAAEKREPVGQDGPAEEGKDAAPAPEKAQAESPKPGDTQPP